MYHFLEDSGAHCWKSADLLLYCYVPETAVDIP